MEISRLTRDGTAEPVSRNQILRRERGQRNIHFPRSADHEQDWQPCPVELCTFAICVTIHHGHSALLKPTGIQFATKPLPGATNREHRKLIGVMTINVFGYELQFLLSDVLPNQQSHQK